MRAQIFGFPRIYLLHLLARFGTVILLALVLSGCQKQADPFQTVQLFFQRLSRGEIKEAYQGTAFGFQAVQTEASFEARVHEMGFIGASTLFDAPEIMGGTAVVRTRVRPTTGGQWTFLVTLIREHRVWRIYSMRRPRSLKTGVSEDRFSRLGKVAGFDDPTGKPIPEEKTVRDLVKATLLDFNRAIRAHSFVDFYNSISEEWKDQITETMLLRTFQPFVNADVDISEIADMEPIFDTPPQIASNGLIVISGHFPTAPSLLQFTMKFIYELPDWKLFSLDIDIKPPQEAKGADRAAAGAK